MVTRYFLVKRYMSYLGKNPYLGWRTAFCFYGCLVQLRHPTTDEDCAHSTHRMCFYRKRHELHWGGGSSLMGT
ncbi:hypothetical protein INT44_005390 [Umbelopsis vinacea]|uniref:Uncharacterized protein n=1 Tax=Umbelopsis vinacea TaxID=44442 RepID=A0A8H7ULK9_9FUNG|nr:hypothetical protein INT44_005390 [Umbelopsis vinacea]